ncbi:transient receptor potential cation channel protein painless-like [Anopheles aquasalis]|uniref:transient receptor potential cation channel protein painless-like n=1 Tax=Anopheles aquasalis TaxID=42839 RepID=UPI00215B0698|nr:transient receptor potential cation channel protein painless-like [Anopheles aquasalis]
MGQQDHRYLTNHSIAQNDLRSAISLKNYEQFVLALGRGAVVNERDETEEQSSGFEECLKQEGMAIFIRTCLEHGAHVASFNPINKKYPIHLAVETCDVHNLQELVKSHLLLIDQKFNGCTALLMLFEMLTAENWENVFECIKVLLEQGADINTSDPDEKSPIAILVSGNDSWRKPILEYCFAHHYVDVDIKMSATNNELIRDVIQNHFPDVAIPVEKKESKNISLEYLSVALLSLSEIEFLELYRKFRTTQVIPDDGLEELLYSAVASKKLKAINVLLEPSLVSGSLSDAVKTLSWVLHRSCETGNALVLEWCLNYTSKAVTGTLFPDDLIDRIEDILSPADKMTLLSLLIEQMDPALDASVCPFFKCLKLLLNDGRIDIDRKRGFFEATALHYAAKHKIVHVQELLLTKGATLGVMDLLEEMPISEMDPIVLENHLDSCVIPQYWCLGDKSYQIKMDLSNFVKPSKEIPGQATSQMFIEMLPILRLSQSLDKKHLLLHPMILIILLQKWSKLKYFFYANLLLCAVFTALFMLYVTLFYGRDDSSNVWYSATYISLIVLIICMALRELLQCCLNAKEYIRSWENYLEIALIAGAAYVLYLDYINDGQTAVPALIAILPALNLTLLVGSLPILSLSTHMVMLKTVSKNFFECFLLYAIILVTFAASFYTLFRETNSKGNVTQGIEQQETVGENITEILKSLKESIDILNMKIQNKTGDEVTKTTLNDDEEQSFDTFENFPLSIVKTIVMLTGELNVSDMPLTGVIPYIILVIFVFFVPIVLANLINGLAISDIAAIKAESEIIGLVQRVTVIHKLETALVFPTFLQNITDRLSMLRCFNRFSMFSKMDVKPIICFGWKRSKYSKELSYGVWLMVFKSTNHPKQTNFSNIYENCEAERSGNNAEDTDSERFENHTIPRDNKNYRFMSLKKDERIVKYMLNIMKQRRKTIDPVEDKLTRLAQQQEELMNHIATLRNELHGLVDSIKDKFAQEKPPSSV